MENKFSETLRYLLQQRGVTHAKLAEVLGVATNSVTVYCTGKARPNIDTLIKIASYFGVSLDYLITGQNPENKVLSEELGLSEITLQTLKEVQYGEQFPYLSSYIDRLLSNTDFLKTFNEATHDVEDSERVYAVMKPLLEAERIDEGERKYIDFMAGKASIQMFRFFSSFFKEIISSK